MAFDLGTGIDFSSLLSGSDQAAPLPDNSLGAPIQQPSDPTGNGSGQFVDMNLSQLLTTGLNYVLQRDQQTMQQQTIPTASQVTAVQTLAAQQRARTTLLLMGGGVLVVALLIAKG